MKKILYFAVIAAAAAVACQKVETDTQELVPQHQEEAVVVNPTATTFRATIAPATRTYLDGTVTNWTGNEWISILSGGHNYGFGTTDSGETANFSYANYTDGSENTTAPEGVVSTDTYAVYPYNAEVTLSGTTASAWIAQNQGLNLGAFSDQHPILIAKSDAEGNLAFKNATAVIKFTLEDATLTDLWIKGNNGEYLAGLLDMTYDGSTLSSVVNTDNSPSPQVYLTPASGDTFAAGTYYFTIAPATLSEGFYLEWTDPSYTTGSVPVKKKTTEQVFAANTIYNLGTISKTTDSTAPAAEMLSAATAEVGTTYTLQVRCTDNLKLGNQGVALGITDNGWSTSYDSLVDTENAINNWTTSGVTYYTFSSDGSADWTYEWNIDFPSAGTYIAAGYVYDYAGNSTWYQFNIAVTDPNASDTEAPTVVWDNEQTLVAGTEYTLNFTVSDASNIAAGWGKIGIWDSNWTRPTVTANTSDCVNASGLGWTSGDNGWFNVPSDCSSFTLSWNCNFPSAGTYYLHIWDVADKTGNGLTTGWSATSSNCGVIITVTASGES